MPCHIIDAQDMFGKYLFTAIDEEVGALRQQLEQSQLEVQHLRALLAENGIPVPPPQIQQQQRPALRPQQTLDSEQQSISVAGAVGVVGSQMQSAVSSAHMQQQQAPPPPGMPVAQSPQLQRPTI